jgi:hypothetical protein
MLDWFEGLAGPAFATAVLWTFAALILLVIVLVIIKLIRSMTFGTFVAGGRNRKTRLAVMDATAVDSHRRLVLVRRDDIEHLILIGGPTDVVVEREIRYGQSRRPAFIGEGTSEAQPRSRLQEPAPARAPAPPPPPIHQPDYVQQAPVQRTPPAPAARPAERTRPAPIQTAPRPTGREQAPPPRPAPQRLPPASLPVASGMTRSNRQPAPPPAARANNLDDTLMRELEVTFDASPAKAPAKVIEMTLDDEMTKLLGELSSHKR